MFNNEVTYHDKWKTPENEAALKELTEKYFDNSECRPDCPLSWAPEVLEMMNTIQKELKFQYNESTIRGYYIQGSPLTWFVREPWSNLSWSFKNNFFKKHDKPRSFKEKLGRLGDSFTRSFKYGFTALKVRYVNPRLNKLLKPKVSLGQLKEKYGSLRVYFNAPPAFDEWINHQIRLCEVKLAMKGAYYSLESLYNSSSTYHVNDEYRPDSITSKIGEYDGKPFISVTETTHRKAMKELGLNLQEIAAKVEETKKE